MNAGVLQGAASCVLGLVLLGAHPAAAQSPGDAASFDPIIGAIRSLESDRDPKCYATAARLEDFMYGTPLDSETRFAKIDLQKALVLELWRASSAAAEKGGRKEITDDDLGPLTQRMLRHRREPDGDRVVTLPDGGSVEVDADDLRQYSSVAYALRAILAARQDTLLAPAPAPLPLDRGAVDALREFLDVYTLTVLQLADSAARLDDRFAIDAPLFTRTWHSLRGRGGTAGEAGSAAASAPTPAPRARSDFELLRRIVAQKVASYEAYNQITSKVFLRNLQVYFARRRWPEDPALGERFKSVFTEAMVAYTTDLMLGAEASARAAGQPLIRVADVERFAQRFLPHRINEYEDAVFFPNLPHEQRITIESYDMDAFRDSGIHWRYLQWSIEDPELAGTLEPDPFAAELLAENAAQFGVLLLRETGEVAAEVGEERLHPDQIGQALERIQGKIHAHAAAPPPVPADAAIVSSGETLEGGGNANFFTDVSGEAGIEFAHRSSDWLSRLLRSYLRKGEGVGVLTVPPAFGGGGVAAEDVDGDGDPDVLLVGGAGNALLRNDGGRFTDVTEEAGLDWRRPDDHLPGEPRQPLIADFDNDGRQDILITYVEDDHRLYRNLGGGRFADATAASGLGGKGLVAGPATAFDYDGDGLLDVYIGYFGDYPRGTLPTLARRNRNGLPDKLLRNAGGLRFEDVTERSGTGDVGWAQALSHTDFDGDGRQDLIVGNDFGVNSYYRNMGDGRFEDVAAKLGTDKPSYSMNVGITDLNGDGFPDVYISNIVTMNKDEKYVAPSRDTPMKFDAKKLAHMRVVEANDLFVSQTEGGRLARYLPSNAVARGRSSTGWAWDADFFDFDNDGDDDLYCLNGINEYSVYGSENPYYTDPLENQRLNVVIPVSQRERNVFFVNEGGRLRNETQRSGVDLLGNSRSAAYLDYDGDGDLDIVLNNFHAPAVLYRNDAERLGRHWLTIRLTGDPARRTNRDAIGARLVVTGTNGRRIWREVQGSIGYLSVHPKEQHFGLGEARTADVTVHWPNGERAIYRGLQADRSYSIRQGQEEARAVPEKHSPDARRMD
jgi:hypothetical protein